MNINPAYEGITRKPVTHKLSLNSTNRQYELTIESTLPKEAGALEIDYERANAILFNEKCNTNNCFGELIPKHQIKAKTK